MKRIILGTTVLFAFGMIVSTSGFGADPKQSQDVGKAAAKAEVKAEKQEEVPQPTEAQLNLKVPLFSPLFDEFPIATVNDEPILLKDFKDSLAAVHSQMAEGKMLIKKDYSRILNRLISVKLILLESANMGFDEIPDIKKAVSDYETDHLREMLKQRAVKDLKPDEKLVEYFYKVAVQEWKISTLKFDKEEGAKAFVKEIEAGGDFDKLFSKLIESKIAEGAKEQEYLKPAALLPQIASVVSGMKVGSVSPVIPVGSAFTVLKLEDVRYPPDNSEARESARNQALEIQRQRAMEKYNESLKKNYATINQKLLKKLDFEARKPGFEKLLKDKRVIVRVKGEKPITVADLAKVIKGKFYHGVEQAIKEKKANEWKTPALDEMIYRLTFTREAIRLGIDKMEVYKKDVKEYKNSLLFETFIKKVVIPDVKVQDDEIKAYYTDHIAEYSSSELVKIQGLVFQKKNYAEAAIDRLRKGTDFDWVKNNAEGQIDREKSEGLLEFSGKLLTLKSLPEGIQKAVADAKPDDVRFYATPEGYFYALLVKSIVPATPSPLETERKGIAKKVFGIKLNKAVDDWAEKLKKAYTIKIFITDTGK